MSGALGPSQSPMHQSSIPLEPVGATEDPRAAVSGSHLLVVDPVVDGARLTADMAARGVQVTVTDSTIDGLVQFGRHRPTTVVVSSAASGLPPARFVQVLLRFADPFVIAVLDRDGAEDVGELVMAGSSAVIERPYDASSVWELFQGTKHPLQHAALLVVGPLELDARAFAVKVHGERVRDLPHKEFELLRTLMDHAPDVVSDDELRLSAWGAGGGQILDNTVAVHVARLRSRLEGAARIRRVRGQGYALAVD